MDRPPSTWFLIGLALAVYVYPLSLDIPLLDPDEGLHAAVAQEMAEGGDYVSPSLLGVPFYDKPILFTWAQALSLSLFGMNELGSRIPGMLFGLLGTLTTCGLAWRFLGREAGIYAALFYMTMVLPVALAQGAVHDVALVPWTNVALLSFWEAHHATSPRRAIGWWIGAGVMLGLACLTKGLIGAAIVGLAFSVYVVVSRSLKLRTVAGCLTAVAAAALCAAPWFLAMSARHPGYAYYYFVERHMLGYVTSTQTHGRAPWWYYVPILVGGGLPWIAYLPAAVRQWWAARQQSDEQVERPLVFCWTWMITSLVFLSFAHSKLLTYLSPIFPAVAILAAAAWSRPMRGTTPEAVRNAVARTFCLTVGLGPVVLPIAMLITGHRFGVAFSWWTWLGVGLIACGNWLALFAWLRRSPRHALSIGSVVMGGTFVLIMTAVVPRLADTVSARSLAEFFNRRHAMPSQVLIVEERVGSLFFYLDPRLRATLGRGQIRQVSAAELAKDDSTPPGTMIVVPKRKAKFVTRRLIADRPTRSVGHYQIYEPLAPAQSRAGGTGVAKARSSRQR